jgi:6-phosphogluconolactonase
VRVYVGNDAAAVARQATALIVEKIGTAVAARGRACLAFSGGRTPWPILRTLADTDAPWQHVHIFQTDERIIPMDDPARTFPQLRDALLSHVPIPPKQVHPMPVDSTELEAATRHYATSMEQVAGKPPLLDLVHLGLGDDGHIASLVPGDAALEVCTADVALSGPYQGYRRMTVTFPLINRAATILWLVTGRNKASVLARLWDGDLEIPAGRVRRDRAAIVTDQAAAQLLSRDVERTDD